MVGRGARRHGHLPRGARPRERPRRLNRSTDRHILAGLRHDDGHVEDLGGDRRDRGVLRRAPDQQDAARRNAAPAQRIQSVRLLKYRTLAQVFLKMNLTNFSNISSKPVPELIKEAVPDLVWL